ncbi:hypothetical protein BZK31_10785 [Pseudomonas floridensis]|uniref:Uncharacterized protein n=1 Tax=Pseudomonas floridensis TaxID=1958950 RepID=A0A1X0N7K9_9PSED|nr:hypothetical protein [Pseudomonas floridensis]ORC59377.1 hypothetical protein BZK31_10785 [Pseudomonas floridensis]
MNNKSSRSSSKAPVSVDLITAVEAFVANGGVIAMIPDREATTSSAPVITPCNPLEDSDDEQLAKVQLLKELVAKGAGFSALQYSLRMNRKDIRQLAVDHGVRIHSSRPVEKAKRESQRDTDDVDDVIAGHVMHYSSLGYTASEIAQVLELSLRQVWNIGKAYRFELRQERDGDTA